MVVVARLFLRRRFVAGAPMHDVWNHFPAAQVVRDEPYHCFQRRATLFEALPKKKINFKKKRMHSK